MVPMILLARIALLVATTVPRGAVPTPASWTSTGPVLYQVNAVAAGPGASVLAAASIYAVHQSAIFQSPDAGATWNTLVEAPPDEFFSEITVDPRDVKRLFAGSLTATANIYRSVDSGATWSKTQSLSPSCTPSFAPGSSHDVVLVACGQQALRSSDGGATWVALTTPFTEPTRLASGPSGLLLAYGATSIFRTTNDGATWVPAGSAPPDCARTLMLRVDPTNASVFLAATAMLGTGGFQCGGVFRSTDAGKTWSHSTLPALYFTDVTIDPSNSSTLFASASYLPGLPRGAVFISRDAGGTWEDLRIPAAGAVRLAISQSGSVLHAATPIGVFDRGFRTTHLLPPRE